MFAQRANLALNRKDFERSQALAEHVSATESKESWLAYIGFNQTRTLIKEGQLEQAEKSLSSHLNPELRAALYSWIASAWLKRGEGVQADRLVSAATAEAVKIDQPELRAKTYIFLANGIASADASRAFRLADSAMGDINASKDFDPKGSHLTIETRSTSGAVGSSTYSSSDGLLSLITLLAKADLNRALRLGWSLGPTEARAFTLLSACRGALSANQRGTVNTPTPEKKVDKKVEQKK